MATVGEIVEGARRVHQARVELSASERALIEMLRSTQAAWLGISYGKLFVAEDRSVWRVEYKDGDLLACPMNTLDAVERA